MYFICFIDVTRKKCVYCVLQMYDKKSVFWAKKQQTALIFLRVTENKE